MKLGSCIDFSLHIRSSPSTVSVPTLQSLTSYSPIPSC